MLKKILRWLLIFLGVAALLLGLSAWWLSAYLDSNKEKILSEFARTSGLNVTFRELDFEAWKTFPVVTFSVDSIVVRDTLRPAEERPVLAVRHFNGSLTLGNLIFDTLRLNSFELSDGAVYVVSDSLGNFNLGNLGKSSPSGDSARIRGWLDPQFEWSGMTAALTNIDLAFLRPERDKRMVVHLDSLHTETARTPYGIHTHSKLAAFVSGIAFNTKKGAFLVNSPMSGNLHIDSHAGKWKLEHTSLKIRDETFTFFGELTTGPGKGLDLVVENNATHYDSTAVLLTEELRSKLRKFHVTDRFSAVATVHSTLEPGEDPEVKVDFAVRGNDLRVKEFQFSGVHTSGRFVNRLATTEGGIPGSKKNYRIELDSSRGFQESLYVRVPRAVIRGVAGDARLEAPVRITGPAREINERVGTEDFIFGAGRFALSTYVNASLNSVPDIVRSSNGKLLFFDTNVQYEPAGVWFPLRSVELNKRNEDIRFKLQTGAFSTGFTFDLEGRIDNLLPLLLDRPGDSVRTDVVLHAGRIRWQDFLAMFGEDGMFTEGEKEARPQDAKDVDRRVAAMKKALLGLEASFQPRISARFDTVAYYDVFSLRNFNTSLRFDGSTLVMERTSFDWEDSSLDFAARLDLDNAQSTPFRLSVAAEQLDLNRMRPSLRYFGLRLPAGIDSLPHDLTIDFAHRGVINDRFGIQAGDNAGSFSFREGRAGLFSGNLNYAPGPAGLHSRLHLEGNPLLVNELFAAEDFFFGNGRFRIDLEVDGTPEDLEELIRKANFSLQIDSSRVEYQPAEVFVPVRKFSVRSANEHVAYHLELFSDSTRRSVALTGTLDSLTAFLYPEPGKTFRMKAEATAQSLRWSDIQGFIRSSETSEVDTTSFDLQDLLSATGGIFSAFSPELRLKIDTFRTDEKTLLTNVRSGLHLRDSTQLILETSGFQLGDGAVAFSAAYAIDKQLKSPFAVKWRTDSLALGEVLSVLEALGISLPEKNGSLAGNLSMNGDVVSKMDEDENRILLDSTTGYLTLQLNGLELVDWPGLLKIGRKAGMEERFRKLRFGPLNLKLRLENGKVWLPRTEIQSTGLQVFVQGGFDSLTGPDLLIAVPLRNIGRGVLAQPPPNTGFHNAGWKVYFVVERGKDGKSKLKFRLGRQKYYRDRGRLKELRELRQEERRLRRAARRKGR